MTVKHTNTDAHRILWKHTHPESRYLWRYRRARSSRRPPRGHGWRRCGTAPWRSRPCSGSCTSCGNTSAIRWKINILIDVSGKSMFCYFNIYMRKLLPCRRELGTFQAKKNLKTLKVMKNEKKKKEIEELIQQTLRLKIFRLEGKVQCCHRKITRMSPFSSSPGSMVMQILVLLSPCTLLRWKKTKQKHKQQS